MALNIKYNKKQIQALRILCNPKKIYILLFGGSRSGKTWLFMTVLILRCFLYPGSKHLVVRFKRNSLQKSVWNDTFPAVVKARGLAAMGIALNKTELSARFPNGSQIWFNGLNTDEAIESVLGTEYGTIYINEASELKKYAIIEKLMTRLNDTAVHWLTGKRIVPKMFVDCNPPRKSHWIYKLFIKGINPESGESLDDYEEYAYLQVNPDDNIEMLDEKYTKKLQGLSAAQKKRFYFGEFTDEDVGKVFAREWIKYYDADADNRYLYVIQSWDTGIKVGEYNDPSVGGTWGVRRSREGKLTYDLLDCVMIKLPYPELRSYIMKYAKEWTADWVLIEDKGSGQSLLQEIPSLDRVRNYIPIQVNRNSGDKVTRAMVCSSDFEAGIVRFPKSIQRKIDWLEKVEDQLLEFDEDAEEDDIVDMISQFLNWAKVSDLSLAGMDQEYVMDNYVGVEYNGWKNSGDIGSWRK